MKEFSFHYDPLKPSEKSLKKVDIYAERKAQNLGITWCLHHPFPIPLPFLFLVFGRYQCIRQRALSKREVECEKKQILPLIWCIKHSGQHQCPYGSPAPQPRTDVHRYIILLFEHQGRRVQVPQVKSRAKFSVKQFMQKNNLGKLFTYFSKKLSFRENKIVVCS